MHKQPDKHKHTSAAIFKCRLSITPLFINAHTVNQTHSSYVLVHGATTCHRHAIMATLLHTHTLHIDISLEASKQRGTERIRNVNFLSCCIKMQPAQKKKKFFHNDSGVVCTWGVSFPSAGAACEMSCCSGCLFHELSGVRLSTSARLL